MFTVAEALYFGAWDAYGENSGQAFQAPPLLLKMFW